MVASKTVLAMVTRASEEISQTEGDVGRVVDVAIGIAFGLAAYDIIGGGQPLLPDNLVDGPLEVGKSIHILCPMNITLRFKYEKAEELTSVFFFRMTMSWLISPAFAAAWST